MKDRKKILFVISLLVTVFAVFLYIYLTFQYYDLKFGRFSGDSLCNISQKMSCSAVSVSEFSTLFGMPISLWGAISQSLFLFLLIFHIIFVLGEGWSRLLLWMSSFFVLSSAVMAFISFYFINVYCIFCIGLYICSLLNLFLMWQTTSAPRFKLNEFRVIFTKPSVWFAIFSIPCLTYLFNDLAHSSIGGQKALNRAVEDSLSEWRSANVNKFDDANALSFGASPEKALATLVEFSDFRCSHCKSAFPILHSFVNSHQNIRLIFIPFPLDGECNSALSQKNGISCRLAKSVYCSEQQKKGWQSHDWIFARQNKFDDLTTTDNFLKKMSEELLMDWNVLKKCLESSDTDKIIKAQSLQGKNAGVIGTPSIFLEGKLLPHGQILPILESACNELKIKK